MNKIISMSIFALLMVGCATAPETTMTPLQTQAMQSREYTEDRARFTSITTRYPSIIIRYPSGREVWSTKGVGKRQNFHSLRDIGR